MLSKFKMAILGITPKNYCQSQENEIWNSNLNHTHIHTKTIHVPRNVYIEALTILE